MTKEYRTIIGTEGHADYIIVGSHDGMVLAVKAICESGMPTYPVMQLGVRIRVAPEADTVVTSVPNMAAHTYPLIPFQKKADTHCSLVLHMKGGQPPKMEDGLSILNDNVLPQVEVALTKLIETYCNEVPLPEAWKWIVSQLDSKMRAIYGESLAHEEDAAIPATSAPADVIDFFGPQVAIAVAAENAFKDDSADFGPSDFADQAGTEEEDTDPDDDFTPPLTA